MLKLALVVVAAVSLVFVPSAAGAPSDVTIDDRDHRDARYEQLVHEQRHRQLGRHGRRRLERVRREDPHGRYDGNDPHVHRLRPRRHDRSRRAVRSRLDKTTPSTTASAEPAADTNGWYNHPLTVSFSGSDVTAGIASCSAPVGYNGPDTSTTKVSGSCTDNAGNVSTADLQFKYDSTPPTAAAAADRVPDTNGWYNHPLTVSFSGSDATAGFSGCSAPVGYNGPDTSTKKVSGSCTDNAGNVSTRRPAVQVRLHPADGRRRRRPRPGHQRLVQPSAHGQLLRQRRHRRLLRLLRACRLQRSGHLHEEGQRLLHRQRRQRQHARPAVQVRLHPADGGRRRRAASRTPTAGTTIRSRSASPAATPPPASPAAPRLSATTVRTPPRDGQRLLHRQRRQRQHPRPALQVRLHPPTAAAAADRVPDTNGWYNHPLTVSFSGSDATAGFSGCSAPVGYNGPDTSTKKVSGSCTDNAGNVSTPDLQFKYDSTPPTAAAAADRVPDTNGWYNHPLTVSFSGSDATAGFSGCSAPVGYNGPDTSTKKVSGSCTDNAGNVSTPDLQFKYDSTPPTAAAAADRVPDTNGWYNHALTVSFSGSDATAGFSGCSAPVGYNGPDTSTKKAQRLLHRQRRQRQHPRPAVQVRLHPADGRRRRRPRPGHQRLVQPSRSRSASPAATPPPASPAAPRLSATTVRTPPQRRSAAPAPTTPATSAPPTCGSSTTPPPPTATADTEPRPERERLVQPRADGQVLRHRRHRRISGLLVSAGTTVLTASDATVSGSCTDNAGNVHHGEPAASSTTPQRRPRRAAASRAPNANGWYNHRAHRQLRRQRHHRRPRRLLGSRRIQHRNGSASRRGLLHRQRRQRRYDQSAASSTTQRRPRRPQPRVAARTPTAGTTTRSPRASPERTPLRASPVARPPSTTARTTRAPP